MTGRGTRLPIVPRPFQLHKSRDGYKACRERHVCRSEPAKTFGRKADRLPDTTDVVDRIELVTRLFRTVSPERMKPKFFAGRRMVRGAGAERIRGRLPPTFRPSGVSEIELVVAPQAGEAGS